MSLDEEFDRLFDRTRSAAVEASAKEMEPITKEYSVRLRRFLTAGNAGGLVAALSLSGSMMAKSASLDPGVPILHWSLFAVTFIFLIGLAGAGLSLFSERWQHKQLWLRLSDRTWKQVIKDMRSEGLLSDAMVKIEEETFRPAKLDWQAILLRRLYVGGQLISTISLAGGAVLGVVLLASFTVFPWQS